MADSKKVNEKLRPRRRRSRRKGGQASGGRRPAQEWLARAQFAFERLQAGVYWAHVKDELQKKYGVSATTARTDMTRAYELLRKSMEAEIPSLAARIYYKFWSLAEKAEQVDETETARKCLRELCMMFGLQDIKPTEAGKTAEEQARALTPRERQERIAAALVSSPELLRQVLASPQVQAIINGEGEGKLPN